MNLPLTISIIVLVLLSGFFSATETAFSCANKVKLKTAATQGKKHAQAVSEFADEKYDKLVTAILIGNNIVNLSASAIATVLFAQILVNKPDIAPTVSTAVITVVVLLFGEITPKYLASVYPEKTCFLFYPLMQFFFWILYPLSKVFDGYKGLLAKIFKLKKDETVTDEEILSLVEEAEESGSLKEDEGELVRSALSFNDLKVEDILVPRVDVYAVGEDWEMEEIREVFDKTGYSRLPVYGESIDDVLGLIHERDFFRGYIKGLKKIKPLIQEIVFTTEHTRISSLLKQLQKEKVHMAAVSDEYGGVVGIVTLEDILEELVGEIWDEHDEENVLFGQIAEGEHWVDGKCPLEEFFTLYQIEVGEEEYESNTIGGWVTELFGGIPPVGERVFYRDIELKVVKATKQKVLKIRAKRLETAGKTSKE